MSVAPKTTMLGALAHYITHAEPKDFQPMKANFGIMPDLATKIKSRQQRKQAYVTRALAAMQDSIAEMDEAYLAESTVPDVTFT
jgi:methylenetetrahydrofolate--tRNA-(uracil-5-)-methyltransferase